MEIKVGKGTAGSRLKALHRKSKSDLSLRAFARKILNSSGDEFFPSFEGKWIETVQEWQHNKSPAGQTQRSVKNRELSKTIGATVKLARRAKNSKK